MIALYENGSVNGVPVKPTIGDLGGEEGVPVTVGEADDAPPSWNLCEG